MRPATVEFLKQRFTEYYRRGNLVPPSALEQREWGFIFFEPTYPEIHMRRHLSFGSRGEILEYLKTMVPAHAYYSSAYYSAPSAGTMNEKLWSGADLIFDLDADHIMRGPYAAMLERVKEETGKLIRMLTEEMGFAERSISVVFSGGRGYHVHIRDISIRGWGSQERREMVDYVCGIGLDPKCLSLDRNIPRSGWRGRYLSALLGYLRWLLEMPSEEAVRQLESIEGVGKKSALEFVTALPVHIERAERGDAGGVLSSRAFRAAASCEDGEFRRRLRETAALADEPVTTDIKRLIRMPTSLHGGSGFRVTPIATGELLEFDPLIDAVIFGEREVKVEAMMNVTMPLLGNTHQLVKGVNSVPEALAVFLCCRGIAEIAGGVTRAP